MYIIRSKRSSQAEPGWVVMKTPLGPAFVAFIAELDAQAYLTAIGAGAHLEAHSHDSLLNTGPGALDGLAHLLLFPSFDEARKLLRDPASFPFERFIIP